MFGERKHADPPSFKKWSFNNRLDKSEYFLYQASSEILCNVTLKPVELTEPVVYNNIFWLDCPAETENQKKQKEYERYKKANEYVRSLLCKLSTQTLEDMLKWSRLAVNKLLKYTPNSVGNSRSATQNSP